MRQKLDYDQQQQYSVVSALGALSRARRKFAYVHVKFWSMCDRDY